MHADITAGDRPTHPLSLGLVRSESKPTAELRRIIQKKYADDDYIGGRYLELVKHYDRVAHADQNIYFGFQNLSIIATATTTFLIGLEKLVHHQVNVIQIAALVTSLLATALASLLKSFNYQAKWVAFRSLRESLISEFYHFDLGLEPYSTTGDKKMFAARIEALMTDANTKWSTLQAPTPENG